MSMLLSSSQLRQIADAVDQIEQLDGVQVNSFVVAGHTIVVEKKEHQRETATYYVKGITSGHLSGPMRVTGSGVLRSDN